jgi:hypothetical protein
VCVLRVRVNVWVGAFVCVKCGWTGVSVSVEFACE